MKLMLNMIQLGSHIIKENEFLQELDLKQHDFIDDEGEEEEEDDNKPSPLDQNTISRNTELKNFIIKKHKDNILTKIEEAYYKTYGHSMYEDLKNYLI